MDCPSCSYKNPEDARFCAGCGLVLRRVCHQCKKVNPPKAWDCEACGASLSSAPERKVPRKVRVESALPREARAELQEERLQQSRVRLFVPACCGLVVVVLASWGLFGRGTSVEAGSVSLNEQMELARAQEERDHEAACANNLKLIFKALSQYLLDHDGRMPTSEGWREAIRPYLTDPSAVECPARETWRHAYILNPLLASQHGAKIKNWEETVLVYEGYELLYSESTGRPKWLDHPPHPSGAHVLFGRGRVESFGSILDLEARGKSKVWATYLAAQPK